MTMFAHALFSNRYPVLGVCFRLHLDFTDRYRTAYRRRKAHSLVAYFLRLFSKFQHCFITFFGEERFGPTNRVVSIAGHQFVLLNAPGLVEEDYRRHAHGRTYGHWTPLPGCPIDFIMSISDQANELAAQPKILLSHIPLSRPSSKSCGPLREKGTIRKGAGHGYQTMLGKQMTDFLLNVWRPSVVFR
jgi:hypothetical protein